LRPLTKCVVAVDIGLGRPGNASAALGSAVVLRMNNMEFLQANIGGARQRAGRWTSIYVFTPDTAAPLRSPRSAGDLVDHSRE
jgi:hypothetical protein